MDDPINYFNKTIKTYEESILPTLDIDVDHVLSLSFEDKNIFINILQEYYGEVHWSFKNSNFSSAAEAAFQVAAAAVRALKHPEKHQASDLDCCTRIVHSPSLAAYVIGKTKHPHNYIVVPSGFISSAQYYVATIYALASVGAAKADPTQSSNGWDKENILEALMVIWEKDEWAFLQSSFVYSSQLTTVSILDKFEDYLASTAFDSGLHKMMQHMMGLERLRRLGFTNTEEILIKFKVKPLSDSITRLLLIYAILHEFGHLFMSTIPNKDAAALAANETGADLFGTQILWRIYEENRFNQILPKGTNYFDILSAIAAFHSWNLSKSLAEVLATCLSTEKEKFRRLIDPALDRLHQSACRWYEICKMITKVLSDGNSSSPSDMAVSINTTWNIPCGGLLLFNFRARGLSCDLYQAGDVFPLLANRQSKIYEYLSRPSLK